MMTANLTVPGGVWACKQPGAPLVAAIVEGDGPCDHKYLCCEEIGCLGPNQPPAWLVALRDARCERGCGERLGLPRTDPRAMPCDCVDGRLLHDVLVQTCRCEGGYDDGMQWICENCDGMPFRTVRCLVDVVPVVDPDTAGREPQRPAVVVYGDSGRRVYYERQRTPQYGDVRLTPAHVDALAAACGKPPADWVDGYAVILTTTDQEAE